MRIKQINTIKELGLNSTEAKRIAKLYTGTKTEWGMGARAIAEDLGIPRRKVMRALEIQGVAEFSEGSYA